MKLYPSLTAVLAIQALLSLGTVQAEETKPQRQRVATEVGGGSAADLLNMRAAPGSAGESRPANAPIKLEITCVDDAGQRFDSHEAGYRECLGRKKK